MSLEEAHGKSAEDEEWPLVSDDELESLDEEEPDVEHDNETEDDETGIAFPDIQRSLSYYALFLVASPLFHYAGPYVPFIEPYASVDALFMNALIVFCIFYISYKVIRIARRLM